MEPLSVIHILDGAFEVHLGFFRTSIVLEIHLRVFQGLEEALRSGIVVRVAPADMLTCAPAALRRAAYAQLAYCTPRSK